MDRLHVIHITSALLVVALTSGAASAQVGATAMLRGTVRDPSGAIVPGATVTLLDTATSAVRTVLTDESGTFLCSLFPSTYELHVQITGFKTYVQKDLALGPGDAVGLDVRLTLGARTVTVMVTTSAGFVPVETGAREERVTAEQIDHLSVIGRSPLELLRILPGIVAPPQNQLESVSFGGGANETQAYGVNGIRSSHNAVSLDGSNLIDIGNNNGMLIALNDDMVQEVKVRATNFAAEYGAGSVSISAITKAGTSRFHGTGYWYGRDPRLGANDRSNTIVGIEKPRSSFFYPGGNLGGPILWPGAAYTRGRDKLFFWIGVEAQRQRVDSGTFLSTTISAAARTGDLSEFLADRGQNLNHPSTVLIPGGWPGAGTPAPANDLRPYVTPLGLALASLYPLPNYSDPDNRYNYVYSALEPTNRLQANGRVDWNISSSTRAYIRVARDAEDIENPRGIWWRGDLAVATPGESGNRGRSFAGNILQVLSGTLTNEILISFSRLTLDNAYRDPSRIRKDALRVEFQGLFPDQTPTVPLNHIYSFGGGQLGNYTPGPSDVYAYNDELLFADKLTKVRGAHALKFGASVARLQKQENFYNNEDGTLFFAPGSTPGSTGSQIGDLLVGRPFQIIQGTRAPHGWFREWNLDGFAQDSWKLRSTLTLDYGARLGYWTNDAERNGLGTWFDPSAYDSRTGTFLDPDYSRLNGVRYAARGEAPFGILDNRKPFALPRVNVVWNRNAEGITLIRGGYGLFVNRPSNDVVRDSALAVPPNAYNVTVNAYYDTSLGGQGLTYETAHVVPFSSLLGSQVINTLTPRSFTFPRTHTYTVSFARRIFWDQTVEAAYVGTTGRRLTSSVNGNVVPRGALSSGLLGNADLSIPVNRTALDPDVVNARRPFPAHGVILVHDFEGKSQYHSLQLTLSRQSSRRVQYFAAYTLSRAVGTLNDDYATRDPFDPSRTYGVLPEDRTHMFNVSWNVFLPDAARGALRNAIGRVLLNGWQLSGISTFSSGEPIHLTFSGDAAGLGVSQAYFGTPDVVGFDPTGFLGAAGNGLAPQFICDPRLSGSRVGERIVNINCIAVPRFGTNGSLIPPYDLRMPAHMNHDLTLFKNVVVRGTQKLQLRAGFFDVFNTAYARNPIGSPDVDLTLETTCNRRVDHVANGTGGFVDGACDPSAGYSFTPNTRANFGRIRIKRGHRIIELVVKYYF